MTGYEEVCEDAIAALRARARRNRRRVLPWLALAAFLLLALASVASAQMTPATVPQPASRLTPVLFVTRVAPPPEYARWYAATEKCAGLKGDFTKVRWYLTAAPWTGVNGPTYGMWQDGHRITLNAPERLDSALVTHEILHDLMAIHDISDPLDAHPDAYFGPGKCAYRFHP